jgi:hypothetical protein
VTRARVLRPALAGGGLVLLLGIVALAATGRGDRGGDGARAVSDGWIDVVFTLALVGMAITIVLLVAGMRLRREDETDFGLKRMLLVAGVFIALFGAIALGVTLLAERDPAGQPPPPARPGGAGGSVGPVRFPENEIPKGGADVGISWPTIVIAGIALLGVLALTVGRARWARRRRRRREQEAVEAVRAVLQDALDELASGDPRVAVIAAFAGMERTLALHGLPRRPAEAPLEYTERVLTELHASADAAAALAILFERARFSTHEIREPDRGDAMRALSAVRDELGEAA